MREEGVKYAYYNEKNSTIFGLSNPCWGVAFHFYQQKKTDPEPVKINKEPERTPKQDTLVKKPADTYCPSEVTPAEERCYLKYRHFLQS